MNISRLLAVSAASAALAVSASAITFSTDFDSATAGDLASLFNTADLSFHNGFYLPIQDGDGIDIDGSDQWQIDTANDINFPLFVANPVDFNYGAAPSGLLSLYVLEQTVLIQFAYLVDITSFSVTLDNSILGNEILTSIDFVNGSTVAFSESIDQKAPGLGVNVGAVSGVRSIVLPTTAFYDNLSIEFTASAIPEPSAFAAFAGVAGLGLALYRRRRRA